MISSKWLNSYIDRILTGTPTTGQSGPGSNGNECVPHIFKVPGLGPHQ